MSWEELQHYRRCASNGASTKPAGGWCSLYPAGARRGQRSHTHQPICRHRPGITPNSKSCKPCAMLEGGSPRAAIFTEAIVINASVIVLQVDIPGATDKGPTVRSGSNAVSLCNYSSLYETDPRCRAGSSSQSRFMTNIFAIVTANIWGRLQSYARTGREVQSEY